MTNVRRILSIDGGGIKGACPAAFLATLEDSIGDNIANYFDLIVGTSTGGIIALGLGIGLSATEILGFYERFGPEIFKQQGFLGKLRHLVFAKYRSATIKHALEDTFGESKLGDSCKRLVIPALNLDTGEAYLYKTAHDLRYERDYKESMVAIALATTAAPTYFPAHISRSGIAFVDGGLWANNPTLVAAIESSLVLNWHPQTTRILSLGCSTTPTSVGLERRFSLGQSYWAAKAVDIMMSGQSSSSIGIAKLMLSEENVVRVSPLVERGRFSMDKTSNIEVLCGLGRGEARKMLPKMRRQFLTEPVDEFKPCRR